MLRSKPQQPAPRSLALNAQASLAEAVSLLQTALAHGPFGLGILRSDLRFFSVNEALAHMNGLPAEAHLGKTLEEASGTLPWNTLRPLLERSLLGETVADFALSAGPKGAWDARASVFPVRAGRAIVGAAVLVEDTTAQAQALAALRQSEARKATILEVALDCIIIMDGNGRIVEFNPAAETTFGFTRAEAVGQKMAELIVPPALREHHYAGFAHFLASGDGPILRKRLLLSALRKDGSEFPVEIAIVPIVTDDGARLFTAYLRDISDRMRAETEREGLLRELQQSARRERTFLRDVLASVTDGKLCLCDLPADLPPALPAVGEAIALSATEGLGTLRHQARDAACARDFADERIYDLLTAASEAGMNAVVHAGGGQGTVCAGAGTVQVWVTDQGHGISMENLPRATLEKGYTTAGTLGHGLKMMLQTADRLWLLTGSTGTTLVLEQERLPRSPFEL